MKAVVCSLLLCGLLACQKDKALSSENFQAALFVGHACEACGMIIKEQPSPRGQLVHRNGKRMYFCSISDMLSYLESPSPHGSAEKIFVESLEPQTDPTRFLTEQRPWRDVTKTHFLLGVKKTGVMGVPILSYLQPEDAQRWAKVHQVKVLNWPSLRVAWKHIQNK